ncbi:hypothetical protein NU219Hw_g2979t1 [Hortaea werneckii]
MQILGTEFNALAATPTVASGPAAVDADGVESASLFTSYIMSGSVTARRDCHPLRQESQRASRKGPTPSERSSVFTTPLASSSTGDYALLAQNKAQSGSTSYCRMFNPAYFDKDGVPYGTTGSLYRSALDSQTWATYTGGQGYEGKHSWIWNLI